MQTKLLLSIFGLQAVVSILPVTEKPWLTVRVGSQAQAMTGPEPASTDQLVDALPEWNFETSPGGPVVSFNGTVEALYAYVSSKYPEHLSAVFDLDITGEPGKESDTPALEKRTDFRGADTYCYSSVAADGPAITNGIKYLRGVKGQPSLRAGGSYRVSCSWNSGIRWSNDSNKMKTLASFGSIADGAQHIVNMCRKGKRVGGIATHRTQWWVEIRQATC